MSKGWEGFSMLVSGSEWEIHAECEPGTEEFVNFEAFDFYIKATRKAKVKYM